jgi:hypothetical protein
MKLLRVLLPACWAAAPLLSAAEISSQESWDKFVFQAATNGDLASVYRALSSEYKAFVAGSSLGQDGGPQLVPYVLPACSRILELAGSDDQGLSERDIRIRGEVLLHILRHPSCRNPAVEKSLAMVAEAIVSTAELGSVVLLQAVLWDAGSVLAGQENLDFLWRAFNRALLAACEAGRQNVVEFLVVNVNVDAPQASDAPMLASLLTGDLSALQQLLEYPGIQPTPRMMVAAAKYGRFNVVEWLCTHYAPLFTKEAMGEDVLNQLLLEATKHDNVGTFS